MSALFSRKPTQLLYLCLLSCLVSSGFARYHSYSVLFCSKRNSKAVGFFSEPVIGYISLASFFLSTAIKTGRYTHEKKARDIEEVKKIKIDESAVSFTGTIRFQPATNEGVGQELPLPALGPFFGKGFLLIK